VQSTGRARGEASAGHAVACSRERPGTATCSTSECSWVNTLCAA
jgi:hypothetical protein